MSSPSIATEQLLELLLTLKKTTPQAARSILNAQPAIAYALMTLMVSMNAVNIEVFQKTLAEYGAGSASSGLETVANTAIPQPQPPTSTAPTPLSAIPAHLQAQYRSTTPPTATSTTPPTHTPTPPYGYSHPSTATPTPPLNGGSYGGYGGYPPATGYPALAAAAAAATTGTASGPLQPTPPIASPQPGSTPGLTEALANIPPEQKALILRVITMTPEQIKSLPPAERTTYIQIRSTLGIPTD